MPRRTELERAEAAVLHAQRNLAIAVTRHKQYAEAAEKWFALKTAAATTLAHREADPALQDGE